MLILNGSYGSRTSLNVIMFVGKYTESLVGLDSSISFNTNL